MTDQPKSLADLFSEEESVMERRSRERRETEAAYLKTPEGKAEADRQAAAREQRAAEREAAEEASNDAADDDDDENPEDEEEE